jgi:hypothetical protein
VAPQPRGSAAQEQCETRVRGPTAGRADEFHHGHAPQFGALFWRRNAAGLTPLTTLATARQ